MGPPCTMMSIMSDAPLHHNAPPLDPLPSLEGSLPHHVGFQLRPVAGLCDLVVVLHHAGRSPPHALSSYPGIDVAQLATRIRRGLSRTHGVALVPCPPWTMPPCEPHSLSHQSNFVPAWYTKLRPRPAMLNSIGGAAARQARAGHLFEPLLTPSPNLGFLCGPCPVEDMGNAPFHKFFVHYPYFFLPSYAFWMWHI